MAVTSATVDMTLVDVLRRAIRLYPDRVAVVDGDVVLTYQQLGQRVEALAHGLRTRGEPGARVAVLMADGYRYLELYFAVPAAGGVLVPLNNPLGP